MWSMSFSPLPSHILPTGSSCRGSDFCPAVCFRIVIPNLQILIKLGISGILLVYKAGSDKGSELLNGLRKATAEAEPKPTAAGETELPRGANPFPNQAAPRKRVACFSQCSATMSHFAFPPLRLLGVVSLSSPTEAPGAAGCHRTGLRTVS